jgi:hypothetical protein
LCSGREPRTVAAGSIALDEFASWNGPGTRYALLIEKTALIFDRFGERVATVTLPMDALRGQVLGWSIDGQHLFYAHTTRDDRLILQRLDGFDRWHQLLVRDKSSSYGSSMQSWGLKMELDGHTLLSLGSHGVVRLDSNGDIRDPDVKTDAEALKLLTQSPSGTYTVQQGPVSWRRDEDVHLLRIVDCREGSDPIPLVRFFGKLKGVPSWSADESRFAFFVQPGFAASHHTTENRLMVARIGDRHAHSAAMPGQSPRAFVWLNRSLLKPYL